jgi:periodic tryptophan protein 1
VYVYDEPQSNFYCHHDILLSSFPLALEWLNVDVSTLGASEQSRGNYVIVGTFLPEIEVWDLDLIDAIQPTVSLGTLL